METTQILDHKESLKFIDSIIKFKHGVFNTNNRNEVTTSINLGVVNLEKEQTIKNRNEKFKKMRRNRMFRAYQKNMRNLKT